MAAILLALVAYGHMRLKEPQVVQAIEQQSRIVLGEPDNGARLQLIKNGAEGILAFTFGVCFCFLLGTTFYYLVSRFVSDSVSADQFSS